MGKNHITVGILAHVDAGKTTLSESLLYNTGMIKSIGRVDNGSSFLDGDSQERARGITIYSKNARIPLGESELILIDTPGHADFAAECERVLPVLDIAVLLVSAPEGVRPHTKTLWNLLKMHRSPTIIFVNKMDMCELSREDICRNLKNTLSSDIVSFTGLSGPGYGRADDDVIFENVASCGEDLMNRYIEAGTLDLSEIKTAFSDRIFQPLFFGSALKNEGITEFLDTVGRMLIPEKKQDIEGDVSGIVYKISHDRAGKRLSFMRILSGTLRLKDTLGDEKVNEIRIYSGEKYENTGEVRAGDICAIVGLNETYCGRTYGSIKELTGLVIMPALSYAVHFPSDVDRTRMLSVLRQLEDEDPTLSVGYSEQTGEITVALMGDIQTEILKNTLREKYDITASFDSGRICYKETIDAAAVGIGHFEPLRHYAEAQIRLEPAERGAGFEFATELSEDLLDRNWQRLILTHLQERIHPGVLLGAPVADIKFTLVAGKSHTKHTEGGDFRQATYRAVRQGLMQLRETGHVHLLEPYYDYTLTLPDNLVGRAMTDITAMQGSTEIVDTDPDEHTTTLSGRAPVSAMNGYYNDVRAYSKGLGELSLTVGGYDTCHNEEEVLAESHYDPETDPRNPTGSVFCVHGVGTNIPWYEVDEYKHIDYSESGGAQSRSETGIMDEAKAANRMRRERENEGRFSISTEEVDRFIRGFSAANENSSKACAEKEGGSTPKIIKPYKGSTIKDKFLIVDGYNVIHAWDDLKELAAVTLDGAAGRLNDILSNYSAVTGTPLIVVYDAYKVRGHKEQESTYGNITVIYTKEAQTADRYIERYANQNAGRYDITVVTSDGVEQVVVRGSGCSIMSSREFGQTVARTIKEYNETYGIS